MYCMLDEQGWTQMAARHVSGSFFRHAGLVESFTGKNSRGVRGRLFRQAAFSEAF